MEDSTPEGADAEDLAQSPIDCTKANLERFELSYCQRVNAAKTQSIDRKPYDVPDSCLPDGCTPDEKDFPRYAASFHKLLKHNNNTGLLTTSGSSSGIANYRQLLKGLKINNPSSDFDDAALNSLQLQNRNPSGNSKPRFLINPRSSKSLNVKGPDIAALDVAKIIDETSSSRQIGDLLKEISLGSAQSAAEMTEAYGMAILRDLVFESYTKPMVPYINDVSLVIDALNAFGSNFVWGYRYDQGTNNISRFTAADEQVTRENLFRGPTEGDRLGDYLSVFPKYGTNQKKEAS